VGAFLTGLREGKVLGTKTKGGRVLVPPLEYDPDTGESVVDGFVDVASTGTIETAAWISEPLRKHPLQTPFAWVLVKLDGADTAFLHALDASKEQAVKGARVQIRWRAADDRKGHISDIECFEPA
jgi:uncharacterized OB-fold protein